MFTHHLCPQRMENQSLGQGARTRHQAAFEGPMQEITTLRDPSLTNNLPLNSAVSKVCLLAAVKATSAGSGAGRDLAGDLTELRLMQRLGYRVNWRSVQGRQSGMGRNAVNTRTSWAQGESWGILEGDTCFQSRTYHCPDHPLRSCLIFSILSVFNVLGLILWRMCTHNCHQTIPLGMPNWPVVRCVSTSQTQLWESQELNCGKQCLGLLFQTVALNTNDRKTD